jgi:outer membrane protein assembly factor BamA
VRGFSENQLGPRVLSVSSLVLTDTSLVRPCTPAELANATCNPNAPGIPASAFHPRPLGGNSVAEGSIEYQFPIGIVNGLRGALFVDGAVVRGGQFSNLIGATSSITPGFGLRFDTYVGPVRLDLGIRPTLVEQLPVVTAVTDPGGTQHLVTLKTFRRYDPVEGSGGIRGILNRLMLHLAIGPAF